MQQEENYSPTDSGLHGPSKTSDVLLSRNLGVPAIVFMVLAGAAPLAVVGGLVPIALSTSGTPVAPLYFIISAVVLAVFSVGFTTMGRFVQNAGAFYSYIQTGFGRIVGSGSAVLAVWSYLLLLIATFFYTGALTAEIFTGFFGTSVLPWWGWAILLVLGIGLLGYRDIGLSAKVLAVFLVAETVAVVVLDVAIISQGGARGLDLEPFNVSALGDGAPGLGVMFAFLGFIGFEATAVFRTEAKDPERTIPRATYIAVIGIGLLYAVSAWAIVIGVGTSNAVDAATSDPTGMVPQLAETYVSPILNDVITILMGTSFLAASLTFHNVMTRYMFTLGNTGLLPKMLSAIHPGNLAPSRASLLLSLVEAVAILIGLATMLDPVLELYTWLSGAAILGLVALMTLTSIAVIVFFRRHKQMLSPWKTTIAPLLATVGLGAILATIIVNFGVMVGGDGVAVVFIVVMAASFVIGMVIAAVMRKRDPVSWERLDSVTVDSSQTERKQ